MNLSKLNSSDYGTVSRYIREKFIGFKTLSVESRSKKCADYYVAAGDGAFGEELIRTIYAELFNDQLNIKAAEARAAKAGKVPRPQAMVESEEYIRLRRRHLKQLEGAKTELKDWYEKNEWQGGEAFFSTLKARMVKAKIQDACKLTTFVAEFTKECKAACKPETSLTEREAKAEFDLMVGFRQQASCSFVASSVNWGKVDLSLKQSFEAGMWAKGSAEARMKEMGFSAELQAKVVLGVLLNVEAECSWTKQDSGIKIAGETSAFVGARANANASISTESVTQLKLAIGAGAFAGVEFAASGSCSFDIAGETFVSVEASASIQFGVGAEFSAELSAPLFGPTSIALSGDIAALVGAGAGITMQVGFNAMELASSQAFKRLVYWRVMARGYEMTLINSDARNLFYLKKCMDRVDAEIAETKDAITSYVETPEDRRALLVASDSSSD